MGAHVIDCVVLAVVQEDGNNRFANLKSFGLPFFNFTDAGDRYEIRRGTGFHRMVNTEREGVIVVSEVA